MKNRKRMISFRVSDEEFEQFRSFCNSKGGNNVSELARSAVQKLVSGAGGAGPLESRIQAVEEQLRRLEAALTPREPNGK